MATVAEQRQGAMTFWQKMALGISAFIIFGFLQFAARGFVNYGAAPVWLHLHGAVMVTWLALFVVQPWLAERNLATHRKLGWIGAGWAVIVTGMASYVGIKAVETHIVPPFFPPPYFLALTQVGAVTFALMVIAAILTRRDTQTHRRLIVGTFVLIMEPALGRLLPMPLLGGWGETLAMVVQLLVLGIMARHDRQTLGHVHSATVWSAIAIVTSHALIEILGRTALFASLASDIAGT